MLNNYYNLKRNSSSSEDLIPIVKRVYLLSSAIINSNNKSIEAEDCKSKAEDITIFLSKQNGMGIPRILEKLIEVDEDIKNEIDLQFWLLSIVKNNIIK